METTEFTPQLVGVDYEAIEKENSDLDFLVSRLNSVKLAWEKYFNERFSIPIVELIFSTKPNLITRMIQERWLKLDAKLSELAKNNRIKIDKLIEITDFPDFEDLKEEIVSLRQDTDRRYNGKLPYLAEIFGSTKFQVPEDLKNKISEKHTYYTKNNMENLVLEKIQSLCASINFFNNCGANIRARDLPLNLERNLTTVRGELKNKELKFNGAGEPNWYTPKVIPYCRMFEIENHLLAQVNANLELLRSKKAAQ
ncbi:hypothetical protein [uncultured Draconibacterium sp.]|uniref:hypothetical protein n=1 Tax=uncultured Draconibacterium sp. TaxID=1573823 RepID=UPI002606DE94|nr:hypothetical protein [uncultured Draconibacterium sp.]